MAFNEQALAEEYEKSLVAGVKAHRLAQGLSQIELADRMSSLGFKFHQATVYKIENGERKISAAEAMGLAEVFNVELDELWDFGDNADSAESIRRRVWTVADRFTQAVLELDGAALRVRETHRALQYVLSLRSDAMDAAVEGAPGKQVPLREFYAPLIAFNLHNELLWRLREEVWSPEFQQAFTDTSGIVLLAPMDREDKNG